MENENIPTILLVDDEESILKSLKRLFRKTGYNLIMASNGQKALELLEKCETRVALILSDQRMPGMSGSEFLEKAKAISSDSIRFLLTGYSDVKAIIDSVNKGEIHRYLTKPWNDEDLLLQVKQALEHYRLIEENKRLLETTKKQNIQLFEFGKNMDKKVKERTRALEEKSKNLEFLNKELEFNRMNIVRAFAALADMQSVILKGHGKRVSVHARETAKLINYPDNEIADIEIAALLHDIGKTGFSRKLLRSFSGDGLSMDEKEIYMKHPERSQSILAFFSSLDRAGLVIRHHHERFDGKGFPDGLAEDSIPMGSKIISIADSYDKMTSLGARHDAFVKEYVSQSEITKDHLSDIEILAEAAIFQIKKNAFTLFDPDIVKIFLEVLKKKGVGAKKEEKLGLDEIEEGMLLSRALYSKKGRFLLPYGTAVNGRILEKLKAFRSSNEIENEIFVIHGNKGSKNN